MNDKLKHRWYQFSLKTLLVVMTLVGIVLGRVSYLRHMAEFHRQEAERWSLELRGPIIVADGEGDFATRKWNHHGQLWVEYSRAVYRPWIIVWEPPEPTP